MYTTACALGLLTSLAVLVFSGGVVAAVVIVIVVVVVVVVVDAIVWSSECCGNGKSDSISNYNSCACTTVAIATIAVASSHDDQPHVAATVVVRATVS